MSNLPITQSNVASDYTDYAAEDGGAGEEAHCCDHSMPAAGGERIPVDARDGRGGGEGGGGGDGRFVMDPDTGYLVSRDDVAGSTDGSAMEQAFCTTGMPGFDPFDALDSLTQAPGDGSAPGTVASPIVADANGNLFVQGIDGQYYPIDMDGPGDAANVGTGEADERVGAEGDRTGGGTTGTTGGGEAVATGANDAEASTEPSDPTVGSTDGAGAITPESAQLAGADYLQSRAADGKILTPDGQPDPARSEALATLTDPDTLQTIGLVYLTALQMSGGSVEYAERAADVFVTDAGSSLGMADKFVSAMLSRGLAGEPDGIDVETFVEMAHDGEFLGQLLGMLPVGEDGLVPQENQMQAKAFFDERAGLVGGSTADSSGDAAADGSADTGAVQTTSTQGAGDAANDSGDAVVDRYLVGLVDAGAITADEATSIAGDATVVANLGSLLQLNEQGQVTTTDATAVDALMEDVTTAIRSDEVAPPDQTGVAGAGSDATEANAVDGSAGVENGDAAESDAGAVDQYIEGSRGPVRDYLIANGATEEIADQMLDELSADESYRAELGPLLSLDAEGGITQRTTEDNRPAADVLTIETLVGMHRERTAGSNGGEPNANAGAGDGANEGTSTTPTGVERRQEQQMFVQSGEQFGTFVGLGEEQGQQLGGGAYNVYNGFFGENVNFAQGGAGIDQFAEGVGVDTGGAFGHVGNIYEGGDALFDENASTTERINGGIQFATGGYELGETLGFWGGGDDDAEFDVTADVNSDDTEIGTYVSDGDNLFTSGDGSDYADFDVDNLQIGSYDGDDFDYTNIAVDGGDFDDVEIGTYDSGDAFDSGDDLSLNLDASEDYAFETTA